MIPLASETDDLSAFGDSGARLALLLRLGDALRPIDTLAEVQATAARMMGEGLGADRLFYAGPVPPSRDLVVQAEWASGEAPSAERLRAANIAPDLLSRLRTGQIDVRTDRPPAPQRSRKESIGTTVTFPMTSPGELHAVFSIHFPRSFVLADHDIAYLRDVTERAWLAIDAVRSRTVARESEARLTATLESVPVGVAVLDNDGRIVLANSEYRHFLPDGVIPSRDPVGRARWSAVDGDGRSLAVSDYPGARAMRGERTVPGQEMLYQADGAAAVWTRVASIPIYDETGAINGQASVISDIDALKRGSSALYESRARAQLLIDGIAEATWEATPDGLIEADSPSWCAYTGQCYDEWKGYGWLSAIHPDDRASTFEKWRETVQVQRAVDSEYRLRRKDGQYRWMSVRAVPLRDEAGLVIKWLGMNIDVDRRKRLEQVVRNNELRTRAMIEGVPQLLWRANHAPQWSWVSPQWTAFTGQSEAEGLGHGWLEKLHPDDRDSTLAAWRGVGPGQVFEVEHRLQHHDGSYRWFSTRAVPVRGTGGEIVEWLGTANDIDALRQAQGRQDIMVAELQHRTRNLIAVIRSLAEKTIDRASSLKNFEQRFSDRLSALSRVQGLLSHATAGRKVTFDELLRTELLALGAVNEDGVGPRVTLAGLRGIPLRSGAVQTLALALHELATNAAKYGALATASGMLAVRWSVEQAVDPERPLLLVEWRESGLTLPDIASRAAARGYGRELIERALPYQLDADTNYLFTEDGLCCTIRVPIVAVQAEEKNR